MERAGVALIEAVIDRVESKGVAVLAERTWSRLASVKRQPVRAEVLAAATLPGGGPLPPSWRAWLAFDGAWLRALGWFSSLDPLVWTPRSIAEIVRAELGPMWSAFFPKRALATSFLLPGGTDSRRVLSISEHPDREGEHPVWFVDVDDQPTLGAFYPGLDVYLGWAAGIVTAEPKTRFPTYTDTAKLPGFRDRNAHHVKHLLGGTWEVMFPSSLDAGAKASKPKSKPKASKPKASKPKASKPKAGSRAAKATSRRGR